MRSQPPTRSTLILAGLLVASSLVMNRRAPAESPGGQTGIVSGAVRYEGKVPTSWLPRDDESAAQRAALTDQTHLDPTQFKPPRPIVMTEDGRVRDVVAALESDAAAKALATREIRPAVVDQIGGVFVPAVTVVPVGGKVVFRNSDQINHNVHLISPRQTEHNFNIGHDQERVIEVAGKTDTVRVVCDLHAWMRASLIVVPTPYYAISDKAGRFRIPGVPPGTYTLKLYHARLAAADESTTVTVTAGKETKVEAKVVRSRRRR